MGLTEQARGAWPDATVIAHVAQILARMALTQREVERRLPQLYLKQAAEQHRAAVGRKSLENVQADRMLRLVGNQSLGDDVGIRWLEGFWVDLHRAYGFYVYVGETAEFVRWIDGEIEAGIGIQGRYP